MKIPVKSGAVRAHVSEPTSAGSGGLNNLQLATMAIAAAVTAANLYYCQPLLSQIAACGSSKPNPRAGNTGARRDGWLR
jgi:hypothetical protein